MKDKIKIYIDKARAMLSKLSSRTKKLAIITISVILIFSVAAASLLNNRGYEVLFTGLNEQEASENPPLGIILCTGKKQEQIELLELDKSGIHVAEYLTVLPPREALQARLQQSIATARARLLHDKEES